MSGGKPSLIARHVSPLLWAAALGSAVVTPGRADMSGDVVGSARVIDGQTLELNGQRLRLEGIDAPLPGTRCRLRGAEQDCGRIATTALMDLVAGVEITCRLRAHAAPDGTRYARCEADGYDLSEGMVYAGWAQADLAQMDRYAGLEAASRAAQRGMWRGD